MGLAGYLRLIRPVFGVLASLASVSAYLYAGGLSTHAALIIAASVFLAEAFLFTTNDIFNLEEDRINRPWAPLVKGQASVKTAAILSVAYLVFGLLLAYSIGLIPFAVYLLAIVLGLAYNVRLKRVPLIGNLTVAAVTPLAFIYGAAAAGDTAAVAEIYLIAFLANAGREVVNSVIDLEGDLKAGIKSIAALAGTHITLVLGYSLSSVASIYATWYALSIIGSEPALSAGLIAASAIIVMLIPVSLLSNLRIFRLGSLAAFAAAILGMLLEALLRQ